MGKQFYDASEAQEKLGLTEEELKALVRDGQLREFRDAGKIRYKGAEVDSLSQNLGSLTDSLGGESGELILEPSEESSMGLTGSDMLTLDEADRNGTDDTAVIDDTQEDTVITSVGISVFDDEETPDVDPGAKTVLDEAKSTTGSSLSLELSSTGTGSGLLDLTREADDTSLGAELLDEIYSEEQEGTGLGSASPAMGSDTRAGLEGSAGDESGAELGQTDLDEPEPVTAAAASVPHAIAPVVLQVGDAGPVEIGLTGAVLGAILIMIVAGVTISANMQNVLPSALATIYEKMPIFGGIFAGVPLLMFVVGLLISKRR